MKRVYSFLVIFLMLFLVTTNLFASGPYYVRNDGNNANTGLANTSGGAWRDISFALAHATLTGGVDIIVHAGTYAEATTGAGYTASITITQSGPDSTHPLRIYCDAPWTVPSGGGCLLRNGNTTGGIASIGNNVVIGQLGRLGFDYTQPDQEVGVVLRCTATSGQCPGGNNTSILGNNMWNLGQTVVDSLGGPGCPSFGAIYAGSTQHAAAYQLGVVIQGNRIANYGDQSKAPRNGGSCNFTQGIYANNPGLVITDNIIVQTTTFGIQFYSEPCGGIISNNTIDQIGKGDIVIGGGGCGGPSTTPGTITLANNVLGQAPSGAIFLGTGSGAVGDSTHRTKIVNNIVPSGTAVTNGALNGVVDISGTIAESPATTFVSYSGTSLSNDYHLRTGSQAIGHGSTACVSGQSSCASTRDLDANIRPAALSIGAFELAGQVVQPPPAPTGLTTTVN